MVLTTSEEANRQTFRAIAKIFLLKECVLPASQLPPSGGSSFSAISSSSRVTVERVVVGKANGVNNANASKHTGGQK